MSTRLIERGFSTRHYATLRKERSKLEYKILVEKACAASAPAPLPPSPPPPSPPPAIPPASPPPSHPTAWFAALRAFLAASVLLHIDLSLVIPGLPDLNQKRVNDYFRALLWTCADCSTSTKNGKRKNLSYVCVTCNLSPVTCHLSPVT